MRRLVRGEQHERLRRELRDLRPTSKLHRQRRERRVHLQHGLQLRRRRRRVLVEHADHLRDRFESVHLRVGFGAVYQRSLLRDGRVGAVLHEPVQHAGLHLQQQRTRHLRLRTEWLSRADDGRHVQWSNTQLCRRKLRQHLRRERRFVSERLLLRCGDMRGLE